MASLSLRSLFTVPESRIADVGCCPVKRYLIWCIAMPPHPPPPPPPPPLPETEELIVKTDLWSSDCIATACCCVSSFYIYIHEKMKHMPETFVYLFITVFMHYIM